MEFMKIKKIKKIFSKSDVVSVAYTYDDDFGKEMTFSKEGTADECRDWLNAALDEMGDYANSTLFCVDFSNEEYEWLELGDLPTDTSSDIYVEFEG